MDDLVGRHVSELDTPMPVIDRDAMERNIARLADHARQRGIRQWPHTKTHKNPEIARMQLDAGAGGLTVAKPGEAEVMASHDLGPLLLHYPSYGPEKWRRIAGVAATADLTVAVDSADVAEPLARELAARGATAQALVELDVGMRRTGVESPAAALALAQVIDGLAGLELAGLSCYPGHVRGAEDEMRAGLAAVEELLAETTALFRDAGLRCDRVSAGSTPSMMLSELVPTMTEHRAGTYVFLDRSEIVRNGLSEDDCALRMQASVVSVSNGRMVLDSGSKTLSDAPYLGPGGKGHGAIAGHPEIAVERLSEEHGVCDISASDRTWRVGDRVEVIPNHVCVMVNLHDVLCGARGGVVERVFAVEARGMVR
jgi:D-serine deaminase-like pyridoxal phosphate-dependent protein